MVIIKELEWIYYYQKKIVFKTKKIARDKDNNFIMMKASLHQEDVIVINICAPKTRNLN